jgi:hypothetical protein
MSWSRRATVLGETAMPSLANSSAMVVVVRRDRAEAGHRIARGIVFEQAMENGDYVRRFFSVRVRPPPVRRVRPRTTF